MDDGTGLNGQCAAQTASPSNPFHLSIPRLEDLLHCVPHSILTSLGIFRRQICTLEGIMSVLGPRRSKTKSAANLALFSHSNTLEGASNLDNDSCDPLNVDTDVFSLSTQDDWEELVGQIINGTNGRERGCSKRKGGPGTSPSHPLGDYSTLVVDILPSAIQLLALEGWSKLHEETSLTFANVDHLNITQEALAELLLRNEDALEPLAENLEAVLQLVSPTTLEIASLDHLFRSANKSSSNNQAGFLLIDDLVELFLGEGLERIVTHGSYHSVHRYDFDPTDSPDLVLRFVWSDLTKARLTYSSHQATKSPEFPWVHGPALAEKAKESTKIAYLVDQAYPIVHDFLLKELKRPTRHTLILSCPEFSARTMVKVEEELRVQMEMFLGGRVDGMIGSNDRKKDSSRRTKVKVFIDLNEGA